VPCTIEEIDAFILRRDKNDQGEVTIPERRGGRGGRSAAVGFDLVADSPHQTESGRPKTWVIVRPPGAQTGILLARADGPGQASVLGNQAGGWLAFSLQVDDFDETYDRMSAGSPSSRWIRSGPNC